SPPPMIEGDRTTLIEGRPIRPQDALDLQPILQSKTPAPRARQTALSRFIGYVETVTQSAKRQLDPALAALSRVKGGGIVISFVALVIVPSFATVIYFALIASDQFTAEARFAVRQIEPDSHEAILNASTIGPTNTPSTGTNGSTTTGSSGNLSFTMTGQNEY